MPPQPKPAPQGLGGMDLGAVAGGARAETNQRISGQSSLVDAYLDQVLGQANAQNAAGSERDQRRLAFERQRAIMAEALERERMGQDAALQRARIEHAASSQRAQIGAASSEGGLDRDHRSRVAERQRDFELGQAAMERPDEGDMLREALENQLLALQVQAAEKELGPKTPEFEPYDVSADRGALLSAGRKRDLRQTTFTDTKKGNPGFELFFDPGRKFFDSPDQRTVTTYDDLMSTAKGYMHEPFGETTVGDAPNEMIRRIEALARNRPQLASLLLRDIGYYGYNAAQE
jgi:hypothetical protein